MTNAQLRVKSDANQTDFNPALLQLAREARAYTQERLADAIGVSQGKLSKIEDGLLDATPEDLKRIAAALDYPEVFFHQDGGRKAHSSMYRRRVTVLKKTLSQCEARIDILAMRLDKLLSGTEFVTGQPPKFDIDEFGGDARAIARKAREYLKIPRGPVGSVVRSIENCGCVVSHFDYGTTKIDGCTVRLSDGTPLILVNPDLPTDRIRRTIVHEFGHAVMHDLPGPDGKEEEEANAFSSEFLMPENDIKSQFYPVSLDKFARMKIQWGVSIQSLVMRASELGVLTEYQKRLFWMNMGKRGWRTTEPFSDKIRREIPTLLAEVFRCYTTQLGYSDSDFRQLLRTNRSDLDDLLFASSYALKVIA